MTDGANVKGTISSPSIEIRGIIGKVVLHIEMDALCCSVRRIISTLLHTGIKYGSKNQQQGIWKNTLKEHIFTVYYARIVCLLLRIKCTDPASIGIASAALNAR